MAARVIARACLGLIVLAFLVPSFGPSRVVRVGSESGGVTMLGRLPLPPGNDPNFQPRIIQVDAKKHRILAITANTIPPNSEGISDSAHLVEYTLDTTVPSITRNVDLGPDFVAPFPSAYSNVVDTKRDRLLMLNSPTESVDTQAVGQVVAPLRQYRYPLVTGSRINTLDLKTGQVGPTWNFDQILPGGVAWGMTYSEKDDLVYVVGEDSPYANLQNGILYPGGSKPPVPAVLMALNPDNGKLVWQVTLPQCAALNTWSLGTLVARSARRDAIYVPCARNLAYPNMAGVERVDIGSDPASATTSTALNFVQEFFPISGVWTNDGRTLGVAAFDQQSDRVALQSLSVATPGSWIFDGDISGWVGFIATPSPYDAIGINQGTGHFYAGSTGLPTLISTVRATPVPQGTLFDNAQVGVPGTFIFTDPSSNRFFLLVPLTPTSTQLSYVAFADTTPDPNPLPPADYDSLTQNIPETADTSATYAGGIQGYGSRISMVGGFGGVWNSFSEMLGGTTLPTWPITGVSPGDRSVALANLPSIDFRNAGSSSSAQAVTPDTNTDEEVRTHQRQVEGACGELERNLVNAGQQPAANMVATECAYHVAADHTDPSDPSSSAGPLNATCTQAITILESENQNDTANELSDFCKLASVNGGLEKLAGPVVWPWPSLACLDAGGSKLSQDAAGPAGQGSASISCDLNGQKTHAESVSPGIEFKVGGATLKIASSSITADSNRTPATGISNTVTAITTGFEVDVPGSGSVSIAKVTSHAVALAHGQRGTASVSLERTLEYLTIRDQNGKVIRSVPQCVLDEIDAECQTALAQANNLLAPRLRLYVPAAELRQTDGGAFAGVEKADAEYFNALNTENDNTRVVPGLQAIFYNDTAEKSRLVVQMAGVEATSIYYLTKNPPPTPQTITMLRDVPVTTTVVLPGEQVPATVITRVLHRGGGGGGLIGAIAGTFAVITRSVGQTITLAAIWLLFGAAIIGVLRRRTSR
ncbi:MAG: hypothetical protein ACYDCC_04415 [Actinomycetota bacterium]